jgi:5-methyltetrahydropteroyltriglutamate--homocysteine methyltransferase
VKRSDERILITHVGSLPRSQAVCAHLLKKERGEACDADEFNAAMAEAVRDVVALQARIGIDVVSDGETAKIGYATYIKDRNTGFGGDFTPKPHKDLAKYPGYREMLAKMRGPNLFRRTCCVGPISPKDDGSLEEDIARFRAALDSEAVTEGFMNAASPGVVAAFQPNRYYDSHEDYIRAVARVMQREYEAIVEAGFLLQVDCPDLAMSRHTGFQDLSDREFLDQAELHVAVLNEALANVPRERVRMHLCWGNYAGPHDFDIPVESIIDTVLKVKAQAIAFEAANPRHEHEWTVWGEKCAGTDTILMPGMLDTTSNTIEHPELVAQRIERFANAVGRERVIASTDCGFGTFVGSVIVDPDVAFEKLRSLVEGAKRASARLY